MRVGPEFGPTSELQRFSRLQLYSPRNARANLHLLGQRNTLLAQVTAAGNTVVVDQAGPPSPGR
jgi:hypothetical protein